MNIKLLLVSSLVISVTLGSQGRDVTCFSTGCTNANCGTYAGATWVSGTVQNKCAIADCAIATLPTSHLTDSICGSCPPSATKIFASRDETKCVDSNYSCGNRGNTDWTDHDCLICNPEYPFTNTFLTECVDPKKSCVNRVSTDLWDDFDCHRCQSQYARSDKTSCVMTQHSCLERQPNEPWTDADCNLCDPTKPFAKSDQKGCANPAIKCVNRNPTVNQWTNSDCQACYTKAYLAKADGSSCELNCNASSGLTDADCASCNGTTAGAKQYANATGACVSVNCKKTSGWLDADCAICDSSKPVAATDGASCIAKTTTTPITTLSSSDTSHSFILVVSILSLIAFLI